MDRIRCEGRLAMPSGPVWCARVATQIVMRIDARRDWRYVCDTCARDIVATSASEASPLVDRPYLLVLTVLATWPPRHRSATKADVRAILAKGGAMA